MLRLPLGGLALALAVVAAGCTIQKPLNVEKSMQVEPGGYQNVFIDAPIRDQKIVVSLNSTSPVDLYVVLESDEAAVGKLAEDATLSGKAPAGALVSNQKSAEATVDATIPGKKGFAILVCNPINGKKADVKLKITNK